MKEKLQRHLIRRKVENAVVTAVATPQIPNAATIICGDYAEYLTLEKERICSRSI